MSADLFRQSTGVVSTLDHHSLNEVHVEVMPPSPSVNAAASSGAVA
jgi:hypothetical protein